MRSICCALTLAAVPFSAARAETVVMCRSSHENMPAYAVEWSEEEAAHTLVKYPSRGEAAVRLRLDDSSTITASSPDVVAFGLNQGRSGYAILYANRARATSLIDIDLMIHEPPFEHPINTDGPVTDYTCDLRP